MAIPTLDRPVTLRDLLIGGGLLAAGAGLHAVLVGGRRHRDSDEIVVIDTEG